MTQDHTNEPRPVYYNYAHLVLPELFFRDAKTFSITMKEQGEDFLRYLWHQIERYESQPLTEVIDEITLTNYEDKGTHFALVHLPQPEHTTEAYFICSVYNPVEGIARYFTLEQARTTDGHLATMMGEWQGTRHMNYGNGGMVVAESFLQAVKDRVKEDKKQE